MALACPAGAAAACYDYEPAIVELSGRLSIEQTFAPPNYGEDPAHDAVETYAVLLLDAPLCVRADSADVLNQSADDIAKLQIIDPRKALTPEMRDKPVILRGMLMGAQTAHHRTPVLMALQAAALR